MVKGLRLIGKQRFRIEDVPVRVGMVSAVQCDPGTSASCRIFLETYISKDLLDI